MTKLIEKEQVDRALNQLLSLIVGTKFARLTDSLKDDPSERIQKCLELALIEYKEASTYADAESKVAQVNRKLDSIQSLTVLAQLSSEIIWD